MNLLALALCAQAAGVEGVLYTGFEAYPLSKTDMERALAPFSEVAPFATALLDVWNPEGFDARIGPLSARMIVGDARQKLPDWDGAVDAWFLDGFSPAKNRDKKTPVWVAQAITSSKNSCSLTRAANTRCWHSAFL